MDQSSFFVDVVAALEFADGFGVAAFVGAFDGRHYFGDCQFSFPLFASLIGRA